MLILLSVYLIEAVRARAFLQEGFSINIAATNAMNREILGREAEERQRQERERQERERQERERAAETRVVVTKETNFILLIVLIHDYMYYM